MATLSTVQNYLTSARVLLQDTDEPYRYSDVELVDAMNLAFLEARRMRADLFLDATVPEYSAASLATTVVMDQQYRLAILYFMVGHANLRDEEDTTDARATAFLNGARSKFMAAG